MARVLQQMKNMSYGQAPDLEGVNDTARPRQNSEEILPPDDDEY